MIAAGTRAPIAIAAKAKPANHPGNEDFKEKRHNIIVVRKLQTRRVAHQTHQGDERQHDRIGWQKNGVLADGIGAPALPKCRSMRADT